jgi:predicted nucleotidyltransferase
MFSNIVINNLTELINIVFELNKLTNNKTLTFKLSNYKKWKQYLENEIELVNNQHELLEIINRNKPHYKGLIKRIKELMDNSELKEIKKYRDDLAKFNINNTNSESSSNNLHNIEAIPKKLAEEGERPTDPIEASVYDLRLVFGFGPANARKMVDKGCRLEYLMDEWLDYVKNHSDNIMISKMSVPSGIDIEKFNGYSDEKKHMLKFKYFQKCISSYKWLSQLTHHQLTGVKYFHHISEKIPREEIIKMEKLLKTMAKHLNSNLKIQCCGSYRRGRDRSGDIDALMCHPDLKTKDDVDNYFNYKNNILQSFVDLLTKYGFITDHLTEGGNSKYMGLCKIPNDKYKICRRIDIRFVPYYSYGTALLYFTGSKNFNTDMRRIALSKNYTLSEYGIFEYKKNPETKKKEKGKQIPTITEEDVFNVINMKYKTPLERDI